MRASPATPASSHRLPSARPAPRLPLALLFAAVALVFAYFALSASFSTVIVDASTRDRETVRFLADSVPANLLALLFAVAAFAALRRLARRWAPRVPIAAAFAALAVWVFAAASWWALTVQSVPAADSASVFKAALAAANGDAAALGSSYFLRFPYQLGWAALLEPLARALGTAYGAYGVVNAALLVFAYGAIVGLCQLLFASRRVTLCAIALLALCVQPIFFCTFIYGNIPSLAAALWGLFFVARLLRGRGRAAVNAILACLFLALAVLAKPNAWIAVVAACMLLLLCAVRQRRVVCALLVVPLVLTPWLALRAVVSISAARADADLALGGGMPQTAWLAMGLQESSRGPGWYNGYTYVYLRARSFDRAAVSARIGADIRDRLAVFADNPEYALSFFTQKALSQWNEPEFESIWVSEVKEHSVELSELARSVYGGTARDVLHGYMDRVTFVLYALFALSMGAAACAAFGRRAAGERRRARRACAFDSAWDEAAALLPLAVLGGVLYHLLFEAKSQYALTYLPMMIPFAAWGGLGLCTAAERAIEGVWKRVRGGGGGMYVRGWDGLGGRRRSKAGSIWPFGPNLGNGSDSGSDAGSTRNPSRDGDAGRRTGDGDGAGVSPLRRRPGLCPGPTRGKFPLDPP